ncbi:MULTISPECIES: hypothetical protein [Sorangium]|uniref:AgmX/PglI C-terminal domain-containing protein n=1 Tax=Sorangium cellulosum TaxID=56 RepID=A0A4P2QX39_SORCE|nr:MULTISPECIES: hypothetical protein [Sorangium]AUX34741.1 hypothetical protein SOCE836_069170 [Sorangium cellulosum]WCQ94052.1 hypothetical protein NQZ70_06809 [Sorangium sp. Soce836]
MRRQLSTPTAILLGSAMIAAAVYLGLRHGPAAVAPDPRAAAGDASHRGEPAPRAGAAEGARAPGEGAPAPQRAPAVPREEVERQAARALDARRPALVERCYKPAIAARPAPREVKYVFNLTFDAQGRQIARGIIEDRETSRPDVTACLVAALPPIAVEPPGASVRVDVPFSLP